MQRRSSSLALLATSTILGGAIFPFSAASPAPKSSSPIQTSSPMAVCRGRTFKDRAGVLLALNATLNPARAVVSEVMTR